MQKRLLLIGGGHSHIEVIRRFGLDPEPGVALTLVSPHRHTAYSGMLPGYIAGHYRFGDCHIDLDALCRQAGADRIEAAAGSLDLAKRVARCGAGTEQFFDVLSIDAGSVPVLAPIPGADRHGIAIKPVAQFLQRWAVLLATARKAATDMQIAIVGAGTAGIEVALAMQHRIRNEGGRARFTVIGDGPVILAAHPRGVQRRFAAIMATRGIALRLNTRVQAAEPGALVLPGNERLAADEIIWMTGAAAPAWPRVSGLQTDADGFIAVDRHLQSLSHAAVFAAGDVASMQHAPRPKSGVYAVRQGPPLAENLRRALRGALLIEYHPQARALALISTGDRHAVASYGPFVFGGAWVWRWKNYIDMAFMRRYRVGKSL
ncbi:MAG: FAD-dependent oxidoreductase [Burkholderiales bacterium]|nr:FAD-dependent oxidoreductase [Burkholderiales bacterium]